MRNWRNTTKLGVCMDPCPSNWMTLSIDRLKTMRNTLPRSICLDILLRLVQENMGKIYIGDGVCPHWITFLGLPQPIGTVRNNITITVVVDQSIEIKWSVTSLLWSGEALQMWALDMLKRYKMVDNLFTLSPIMVPHRILLDCFLSTSSQKISDLFLSYQRIINFIL